MLSTAFVVLNLVRSALTHRVRLYLTGSQFFGTSTVDSDWDFFMQYGPETIDFLERNGFRRQPRSNYLDSQTVYVYQHATHPIHVQLVRSEGVKIRVQNIILKHGLHLHETREELATLWKDLLSLHDHPTKY